MKIKQIISSVTGCFMLAGAALPTTAIAANTGASNQLPKNLVTNMKVVLPDHLNFDKFNVPRACTPAEVYQGKTQCNVCDADTPNIVIPASSRAYGKARNISDSLYIYGYGGGNTPYEKDKYHNAFNQSYKPTNKTYTQNYVRAYQYNRGNSASEQVILLRGYNLTGFAWGEKGALPLSATPTKANPFPMPKVEDPTSMYPMNMRTKCETLRPKYTQAEAIKRGDYSGFRGAAILGIGGAAISSATALKVTNPNGNKGSGQSLGGGGTGSVSLPGGGFDVMARRSFVCLEYHTTRNGMSDNGGMPTDIGGQHIMLSSTNSMDCMQPMQNFYNTFVAETCPYVLCDGNVNGVYRPLTMMVRYMYLMTNPFFTYGRTAMESYRIAFSRPDTMMGF